MDRQDVEYVKRDYDEQFDEFGRIKKRSAQEVFDVFNNFLFLLQMSSSANPDQEQIKDEGEIEDEDDEENGEDMDKYKLGSDVEVFLYHRWKNV